jgi:hypothetical protein
MAANFLLKKALEEKQLTQSQIDGLVDKNRIHLQN